MGKELGGLLFFLFGIWFLVDVFFIIPTQDYGSDARIFLLVFLWIIAAKIIHLRSTETFKLTLAFLILLAFLFIFFPKHTSMERIATYVYIYLFAGIVQQFLELRKEKLKKS